MARQRKRKLIRDMYQDRIPPEDWIRLKVNGRQHRRYLKAKLHEEVEELKQSDYLSIEEFADVVEVLKCLCWFNNICWNDVMQEVFNKQCRNGKFLEGILLINMKDGTPRKDQKDEND